MINFIIKTKPARPEPYRYIDKTASNIPVLGNLEDSRRTHRYGFYEQYLPIYLLGEPTGNTHPDAIKKGIKKAEQIMTELERTETEYNRVRGIGKYQHKPVMWAPEEYTKLADLIEYALCSGNIRFFIHGNSPVRYRDHYYDISDFFDELDRQESYVVQLPVFEQTKPNMLAGFQRISKKDERLISLYARFLMQKVFAGDIKLPDRSFTHDMSQYDEETRRMIKKGKLKFQTKIPNWWDVKDAYAYISSAITDFSAQDEAIDYYSRFGFHK